MFRALQTEISKQHLKCLKIQYIVTSGERMITNAAISSQNYLLKLNKTAAFFFISFGQALSHLSFAHFPHF